MFRLISSRRGSAGSSERIVSLSVIISLASPGIDGLVFGILPDGMWIFDAVLMVSRRYFSLVRTFSVLGGLANCSSIYCWNPSQFAFLKLIKVLAGASSYFISDSRLIWMGRWSDFIAVVVVQLHELEIDEDAMLMSGEVLLFLVMRVGMSSFNTFKSLSSIHSAVSCPRVSSVSVLVHRLW